MPFVIGRPQVLTDLTTHLDDYLNERRGVTPILIVELNSAQGSLARLARALDSHAARLAHGNCTPNVLMTYFEPGVVEKIRTLEEKVHRCNSTAQDSSRRGQEAAEAIKLCFKYLKEKAIDYRAQLTAALAETPDNRWGLEPKGVFLRRRHRARGGQNEVSDEEMMRRLG